MQTNRISEAQYRFLRDVRDDTMLLADFQQRHHVHGKRFSRWMRGIGFRRALTEAMRSSKRQRRLQLRLAASVAAKLLAEAVQAKTRLEEQWQALLERAINQGRKEEQAARAEARGRRGGGGGGGKRKHRRSADDDLCHPNAKADEDELLAILEADSAAGRGSKSAEAG